MYKNYSLFLDIISFPFQIWIMIIAATIPIKQEMEAIQNNLKVAFGLLYFFVIVVICIRFSTFDIIPTKKDEQHYI